MTATALNSENTYIFRVLRKNNSKHTQERKKNMKKIIALLLAASMTAAFASCKKNEDKKETSGNNTSEITDTKAENGKDTKKIEDLTPEEYLDYIVFEKDSTAKSFGEFVESLRDFDADTSENISVHLVTDEAAIPFLMEVNPQAGKIYSDYAWLNNVELDFALDTASPDLIRLFITPVINSTPILGIDTVTDFTNEKTYVTIPDISNKTFMCDISESFDSTSYTMSYNFGRVLSETAPDSETAELLFEKYSDLLIENLDTVIKSDAVISAGDISQKATKITVVITPENAHEICCAFTEEFLADSEIKAFITAYTDEYIKYFPQDKTAAEITEGIYADWKNKAEEFRKNKDYFKNTVELELYANDKHEISAVRIKSEDTEIFSYKYAEKDEKFAFETSLGNGNSINGNGTKKDGKHSGSAEFVMYNPMDGLFVTVAEISFDNVNTNPETGALFEGTFKITPDSEFTNKYVPAEYDWLNDCMLTLTFVSQEKNALTLTAVLEYREKKAVTAVLDFSEKEPEAVKLPEGTVYDASSKEDMTKYASSMNLSTVITNITKAGISNELFALFLGQ